MSWRRFVRRGRWHDERRLEMQSYVEIETDENVARGMPPNDARAAAVRKIGNRTLALEEVYTMNTIGWLDTMVRDIRYGLRVLIRQPAFAIVAVTSLALGVGANTAIFQLIDTVRLRTLPVESPQTLMRVSVDAGEGGRTGRFTSRYADLTYPLYEEIQARQQSWESLAAWGPATFDLSTSGESRPAEGLWVSGNFFAALGVAPALGRLIGPAEDQAGCPAPAAVISYPFWQRQYAGRTDVLGEQIHLSGQAFPIIGITPAGFYGVEVGRQFDVAVPVCAEPQVRGGSDTALGSRSWWWLAAFGRLKPGVSIERANTELQTIAAAVFEATVPAGFVPRDEEEYRSLRLQAEPVDTGFSALRSQYSTPLMLLLALAGLVLFIACGNLANLMLARASAREREMAVRLAIGASRWALVRQLMSESLLIAAAGAALGAWLAHGLSRLLVSFLSSPESPLALDLTTNWRVLAFTSGLAVVTCLLFGLVPAVRATRTAPVAAMRASGRGLTDGRGRFTLRRTLVVGQLAVSLVLLVGALLFVRTFRNLASVDLGLSTEHVVAVTFDFRRLNLSPEAQTTLEQSLVERLRALPGVEAPAPVLMVPVSGYSWNNSVVIDGQIQEGYPYINQVGVDYFGLLDIPITAGRSFTDRDTPASARVAVVNEAFVERYMNGRSALGRRFHFEVAPGREPAPIEIVGVAATTAYSDIRAAPSPQIFLPYERGTNSGANVLLRVKADAPITRDIVAVADAVGTGTLVTVNSLNGQIQRSLVRERLMAMLSGFFGGLALLLAAIGLYGVMSYTVAQRRQEIGIRMALGAGRARMLRMVLQEAAVLLVIGVTGGAVLAMLAGRSAESLLFGLTASDPMTLAFSVFVLGVVGALASLIPAWRAARVEPAVALADSDR